MFVTSKQLKRNLKLFTYDKELPAMGSNSESVVLPVFDCLDSPNAAAPHTKLFSMSKKRNFVASDVECVPVTPAQKALLDLLSHPNAPDYSNYLKEIHELGTYYPEKDLVNLQASLHVHWLQEAVLAIAEEHFTNSKSA